jgi:hypothetical protein
MIRHYSGGPGLTIIYALDENGLSVKTNCDLQDCKETTEYTRYFARSESDSVYRFINSLKLDTLKSSYETKGILDGLFTKISFSTGFFTSYSTTLDNFDTPTTDSLFRFIDKLILTKKYRFYSWGEK